MRGLAGFLGRTALYEVLSVTPALRECIHTKVPTSRLQRPLVQNEGPPPPEQAGPLAEVLPSDVPASDASAPDDIHESREDSSASLLSLNSQPEGATVRVNGSDQGGNPREGGPGLCGGRNGRRRVRLE